MGRSLWIGAAVLVVVATGCRWACQREGARETATRTDGAAEPPSAPTETGEAGSQANEAQPQIPEVEVLGIKHGARRDLPLEQDRLSVFVEGVGRTTVSVAAQWSVCDVQVRLRFGEDTREWSGGLIACELRATDPGTPFLWTVWMRTPMRNFRVVSSPGLASYAAWVENPFLCFEEIRTSRDARSALALFASHNAGRVFTGSLRLDRTLPPGIDPAVPGATRLVCLSITPMGGRALMTRGRLDVSVQSIERDAAGHWTVKVTGPKSDKVYTFVSPDGVNWERK